MNGSQCVGRNKHFPKMLFYCVTLSHYIVLTPVSETEHKSAASLGFPQISFSGSGYNAHSITVHLEKSVFISSCSPDFQVYYTPSQTVYGSEF